jgi:subfamily B ATP-binding cassette protein HlyB/CyaB
MFWYSWQLTLVVLVLLLLLTGLSLAAAPLLRKRLNRQFHAGAGTQAVLTELIANMESVKALQLEPQLRDRYRSLLGEYLHASAESRRLSRTL